MPGNSDSPPILSYSYPVMAGLVPAIRGGKSLRQMADWVAGREEWVAIYEKCYLTA